MHPAISLKQANNHAEMKEELPRPSLMANRPRLGLHVTTCEQMLKRFKKEWNQYINMEGDYFVYNRYRYQPDIPSFWILAKKAIKVHKWNKKGRFSYCESHEVKSRIEEYNTITSQITESFPNLSQLTLNLTPLAPKYYSESQRDLEAFAYKISENFLLLKELTIKIPIIPGLDFKNFLIAIGKYLTNLESLAIEQTDSDSEGFDDSSLHVITAGMQNRFLKLKRLKLRQCKGVTDYGVERLFSNITTNLFNLQHFHIEFANCQNMTERSIALMGIHLEKLTKLESLALSLFNCTSIDDQSIQTLVSKVFHNLPQLKEFALWFWLRKITKMGFGLLCEGISQHLVQLERLELRIFETSFTMHSKNPNITDHELQVLGTILANNLKNLQHLSLAFDFCDGLTDNSGEILGKYATQDITSLQQLRISFNGCPNISNGSIEKLLTTIGSNPANLQRLELSFSQPIKVNNEGLEMIFKEVASKLQGLKWLKLDFTSCVSDKTIQSLKQILQNIQTLYIE